MNELIKISRKMIGDEMVHTVNARDLHEFLGNGERFATWIKSRIKQYGFFAHQDFVSFSETTNNGRPRTEYAISLEMGKELAMVERNEQGKQARQYFIACERQAKQRKVIEVPQTLSSALRLAADLADQAKELANKVAVMQPKAQALDRLADGSGSLCITDAAKHLQLHPSTLFSWLRNKRWIYRRSNEGHWVAYQKKLEQGFIEHKLTQLSTEKVIEQVRVTRKGLARLGEMVSQSQGLRT